MKRIALTGLLAITFLAALAAPLAGCDEEKKDDPLAKVGASASASTAAPDAASMAASAAPSAAASAPPPKKDVVCQPGPELTLTDPDIEAQVRLKLAKPKDPLKMSDLANVKSLDLTKKKDLDDLDPCIFPKMTGLKHLYLGPGKLNDLKPISSLNRLESLRASINEVEDLKPLEKMAVLDVLDLGRTHVRDISSLSALTNLTELQLDNTQVSDLKPLEKLKKLRILSIKNTTVTDVSPLKGMNDLKTLNVQGCAISNLDTIQPLISKGLRIVTK
jgi:internalin A